VERYHKLPCGIDPRCHGPRGTSPLERECSLWLTVEFPTDPEESDPCVLLDRAGIIEDVLHANEPASFATPTVIAGVERYRAALTELIAASRALAVALQSKPGSVDDARRRFREAIGRESKARNLTGSGCE
jgi:hypothetical protein